MTETHTTTPAGDPDPDCIARTATKGSSFYMVLWAPLPMHDDDDDEQPRSRRVLRWRELGWVQAHDPEQAKAAAMTVVRAASAGECEDVDARQEWELHEAHAPVDAALAASGLKLRAIARRGWQDETSIAPTVLIQHPQLVIG
jgi:hypothetical protein